MLARLIAVNFGVAIVFPLLIYYGVSTLSAAPKWNDFIDPLVVVPKTQKDERAAWTEANRVFSLRLLCVAAPLGYAAILLGSSRLVPVFGPGLMFGGIFSVTIGYWFHWNYVEDWLRFLSLLVAMAVLMVVSYWRLRPPVRAAGGTSGA